MWRIYLVMSKTSHNKHENKHNKHQHTKSTLGYEKPHEDYKASAFGDLIIIFLIIGLGLFFILPFYAYIPDFGQMLIMVTFLLIVAVFAGLVWRRKPKDEREAHHHASAGNVVFSLAILLIGALLLYQVFLHKLDPLLVLILLILVGVRVGYSAYLKSKV